MCRGDDRSRRAGGALGLSRGRSRARRSSAHHPTPRRSDRGASAAPAGPAAAQEAPRLVLGRPSVRGAHAPGPLRGHGGRHRPRDLLESLVMGQSRIHQRYFEDFTVGDRFRSPSRTLTDAHFLFFAGMTGDAHPIHYDDEYGKRTRFGRRLAHGLLLTSLTAVGASTLAPVLEDSIVAFVEQSSRFLAPVFIGDTISPEHEVVGLERRRSAGLLTLRVLLRNQRGETVVEGQHRYLIAYRPST